MTIADPQPRRRRTHAERSAATRAKLLEAAIDCLHQFGYAATSTVLVAAQARLSRGAMQHQFQTKVELMLAVIEYAIAAQDQERRRLLRAYPRGAERYIAISEVTYRTALDRVALALLEIEIGSRSDPELAERAPPIFRAATQRQLDSVWEVAKDIGLTDRARVDEISLMNNATVRGLSVALLTTADRGPIDAAFRLMVENKRRSFETLLAQGVAAGEAR